MRVGVCEPCAVLVVRPSWSVAELACPYCGTVVASAVPELEPAPIAAQAIADELLERACEVARLAP